MTVTDILEKLGSLEIRLWVDDGRLKFRSPKGRMTPEIRRMLHQNKPEIIESLLQHQGEKKVTHSLSYNQQSLWFLYQIAPESSCYNVALSCRIVSEIQSDAMREACRKLVKRHEILRTTYGFNGGSGGRTYQTIHSEMEPDFYLIDASGLSDDALKSKVKEYHSQLFDLENGPLLRLCLFQRTGAEHIFLMTIHHIACDGSSLNILLDDFRQLYRSEITGEDAGLPDVKWNYRDFVRSQQEMLQVEEGARLRDFWREQFSGTLPVMALPIDYERPAIQSFTGASYSFQFADSSYMEILNFAQSEKVTRYVFLLAVFQVTLMRCCNQDDIIVGTPAAGRSRSEYKGICGHFINMVAMRGDLSGAITFREHLQRSRRVVLRALDNQAYPFLLLVESLAGERDLSRSPVFQVMFNMLTRKTLGIAADFLIGASNDTPVDFGGLKIMPWPVEQEEGQFDLVLEIIDTEESLACVFKYCTDLFKEETIASIAENFQSCLQQFMEDPEKRLMDVQLPCDMGRETAGLQKRNRIDTAESIIPCDVPGGAGAGVCSGSPVTFMFTGQGAQYVHMAKGIYQCEPVFREYVDYCSEMLKPVMGCDIRQFLYPVNGDGKEVAEKLNQTAITQPVLFTLEYALARLWMSWGVHPQAMVGHSIGEYAAACLAGVFSLDDSLNLVAARGRLMQMQPVGAMLAVTLSETEIAPFIGNGLFVAVMNAPSRCVVSGPVAFIQAFEERLGKEFGGSKRKVHCTRLRTSHAFHSEMMEPAVEPFTECVREANPAPPEIPFISNVTGTWITDEQAMDPAYWAAHLRQAVRFSQGVDTLLDEPDRVLLEVGPGNTLSALARQHIKHERPPVILSSIRYAGQNCSDEEFILRTVNSLQDAGVTVDRSHSSGGENPALLSGASCKPGPAGKEPGAQSGRELRLSGGEGSFTYDCPAIKEGPVLVTDSGTHIPPACESMPVGREKKYWKSKLGGNLPVLQLPADYSRPAEPEYRCASCFFTLSSEHTAALMERSKREGATDSALLLSAYMVLLSRYSGQKNIIVGVPYVDGEHRDTELLSGSFRQMLPVRVDLAESCTFNELTLLVSETSFEALAHNGLQFQQLVEMLGLEHSPDYHPLFQVMFAFQDFPLSNAPRSEWSFHPGGEGGLIGCDLSLFIWEEETQWHGAFLYSEELFKRETIGRMRESFHILIEEIAGGGNKKLHHMPLLSSSERDKLIYGWNDTGRDYPSHVCLHQLFEMQVEKTPDAVAVVFENSVFTYRELSQRTNRLANYLRKLGVGPEKRVGIFMERSMEMIVAIYGTIKAGGAYVPLDPDYPAERVAYMLEDTDVPVLLTQHHLKADVPENSATVICLDTEWERVAEESAENPVSGVSADNLAYVIYTSGSTGKPKGVMNSHRGICNRLYWMQDEYRLTGSDRVLQKTPYSFDVSVWEFFWPLLFGARLVVAPSGIHKDPASLIRLIRDREITTLHFVPSMLQLFLREKHVGTCSSLTRVICSGEALSCELQARFFEHLDAELHNLYGPTEAAVDVTFWECRRGSKRLTVPIGKPVSNTQIYILDRYMQPVPVGVSGELHIGGVQVARGYLNRLELTEEKFVPDPFRNEPGACLYKTGDLARYLPDGNVEYLGRNDFQVKVRGLRIELGEIEAVICQHANILETVVVARDDVSGNKQVVAYYVVGRGVRRVSGALRGFLNEKLPDYMIPSFFIQMDALPLLENGKVNRKALPDPKTDRPDTGNLYAPPDTEVEKAIAEVWQALLGIDKVGIDDNFFEVGGDSLLLVQVANQLACKVNADLKVYNLIEYPTIRAVAGFLDPKSYHKSGQKPVGADIDERLRKRKDTLSKIRKNRRGVLK